MTTTRGGRTLPWRPRGSPHPDFGQAVLVEDLHLDAELAQRSRLLRKVSG